MGISSVKRLAPGEIHVGPILYEHHELGGFEKLEALFAESAAYDAELAANRGAAGDVQFLTWVAELLDEYSVDGAEPKRIVASTVTLRFLKRAGQAASGKKNDWDDAPVGFNGTCWGLPIWHDPRAKGIRIET